MPNDKQHIDDNGKTVAVILDGTPYKYDTGYWFDADSEIEHASALWYALCAIQIARGFGRDPVEVLNDDYRKPIERDVRYAKTRIRELDENAPNRKNWQRDLVTLENHLKKQGEAQKILELNPDAVKRGYLDAGDLRTDGSEDLYMLLHTLDCQRPPFPFPSAVRSKYSVYNDTFINMLRDEIGECKDMPDGGMDNVVKDLKMVSECLERDGGNHPFFNPSQVAAIKTYMDGELSEALDKPNLERAARYISNNDRLLLCAVAVLDDATGTDKAEKRAMLDAAIEIATVAGNLLKERTDLAPSPR
jgi:hypothetical protein